MVRTAPRLSQATINRSALEDITGSEPFLPFPGSILPALLALRRTQQVVSQSRVLDAAQKSEREQRKRQLERERAQLQEQKLLQDALRSRIQALRQELDSQTEKATEDTVRDRLRALRATKKKYDDDTAQLMRLLTAFVDTKLAAMLAAEEQGGPVVGNAIHSEPTVDGPGAEQGLEAAQGRTGSRQRRIDDFWRPGGASTAAIGSDEDGESQQLAAAGRQMRQLMEELLNRLAEAGGNNAASYVHLERESAAARFLVRSKVAQLHPKDALRLRLLDFGRHLAD